MTPMVETAILAEEELDASLSLAFEDPFTMPNAHLYGISFGESDEVVLTIIDMAADVYELLEKPASERKTKFNTFAIATSGWAAPLGENGQVEGAPSEHALRRRVRLLTVASADGGAASVLRFSDVPDEIVSDPGSATGSLANALAEFVTN